MKAMHNNYIEGPQAGVFKAAPTGWALELNEKPIGYISLHKKGKWVIVISPVLRFRIVESKASKDEVIVVLVEEDEI